MGEKPTPATFLLEDTTEVTGKRARKPEAPAARPLLDRRQDAPGRRQEPGLHRPYSSLFQSETWGEASISTGEIPFPPFCLLSLL